jgi:hypothetical protein
VPHPRLSLLLPQSHSSSAHPRRPPLLALVVLLHASSRSPPRQRAPTKRAPCCWCSRVATRRRLSLRGRNQLALASPSPYVAMYVSKCFRCYKRYVASVLHGCCKSRLRCCICCKWSRVMLQVFVQNVSSVSDVCCKHFYLDVAHVSHICCKSMFEIF